MTPHTPAPEYCDEMTCEYQRIEKYPGDVSVYCESKKDCNFKQFGSGETIWCNKPLGSHDAAKARTATLTERREILKELQHQKTIYESSCHDDGDRGCIQGLNIAISVVEFPDSKSLRQQGGEQE